MGGDGPAGRGLRRSLDGWRGTCRLGRFGTVPLLVGNGWLRPSPGAVAAIERLERDPTDVLDATARALLAAVRALAADGAEGVPSPAGPDAVWSVATPVHVAVGRRRNVNRLEIGIALSWDEEHTWGVRFGDGGFEELVGSVRGA